MAKVPSIGRVVHYVSYGTPGGEYLAGAHRAAVVTDVAAWETGPQEHLGEPFEGMGLIGLCILNPTGLFFNQLVPYDETATEPGSWHWPEHVPDA